jgi:glutamyl-tRNA synthetase
MGEVRVRYAPSPTGFLHLGALRTALYNYLFAKATNGSFILRIEDTDRTRYVEGSVEDIINGMEWAGITIDEGPNKGGDHGPYVQSQRVELYKKYANQLLEDGYAYKCFATPEELEEMRKDKGISGYNRMYRDVPPEKIKEKEEQGLSYVIRFKMPLEGETVIEDKIRGRIAIQNKTLQDSVILKSDGYPTYHLAAVVDDHLMEISHILRGEEWINTTPLHVQLYKAFGWEHPIFAHLPVILSATGKGKMSKRDGATQVREYIERGYLPDAMVNFLVNLGWAYDDKRDVYDLKELEEIFDIEKIGKAAPRFQIEKLNYYNEYYIRKMDADELVKYAKPFLKKDGINIDKMNDNEMTKLKKAVSIVQERITLLSDIGNWIRFLFEKKLHYSNPKDLIQKKMDKDKAINLLESVINIIENLESLDNPDKIEEELKKLLLETGLKGRPFFMTIRIGITGSAVSPPLYESIEILGRDQTIKNLRQSIETIKGLT